jgi:uncharacterized membrane protein YidH (DUF202 family)
MPPSACADTRFVGLFPQPGSHAGLGGIVLIGAFVALFVGLTFHDTRDASPVTRVVLRLVIVVFAILCLASAIADYDDAVWFPPE